MAWTRKRPQEADKNGRGYMYAGQGPNRNRPEPDRPRDPRLREKKFPWPWIADPTLPSGLDSLVMGYMVCQTTWYAWRIGTACIHAAAKKGAPRMDGVFGTGAMEKTVTQLICVLDSRADR